MDQRGAFHRDRHGTGKTELASQEEQNWYTGKTDSVSDVRLDSATLAPTRCPEFN
jgi:hypothetical protein